MGATQQDTVHDTGPSPVETLGKMRHESRSSFHPRLSLTSQAGPQGKGGGLKFSILMKMLQTVQCCKTNIIYVADFMDF